LRDYRTAKKVDGNIFIIIFKFNTFNYIFLTKLYSNTSTGIP